MARKSITESLHGPYGLLRRLSDDRRSDLLHDAAQETADIIQAEIIRRVPVDRGRLAQGVEAKVEVDDKGRFRIIATAEAKGESGDDYAPYVDKGTGIFGPGRRPIVPKHGRYMRFFWRKPGKARDYPGFRRGWWKVRKVAGQKPQRFMERGWRSGMRIARRKFRDVLNKL